MSASGNREHEAYRLEVDNGRLTVKAVGRWDLHTVKSIDQDLSKDLKALGYGPGEADDEDGAYEQVIFDFGELTRIDTAGAYVLTRALGCHDGFCRMWSVTNSDKGQQVLMQAAAEASQGMAPPPPRPWYDSLDRMGRATERGLSEIYGTLVFFGQFIIVLLKMFLQPHKIRWKSVVALIETVGLDAIPIVIILSFFIGCVIAYMGSDLLEVLGFQVYVVDLVGVAVLREFGVLITAILLAGRSNSAFTAQIGSMKMRQEIDAMQVIGLDTFETLVAPRALACLISAPILTFAAMISGIFGGLLVSWTQDISPILFSSRLTEVVDIKHFWVGMVKAPVYGLVVAIVGCRQGLAVKAVLNHWGLERQHRWYRLYRCHLPGCRLCDVVPGIGRLMAKIDYNKMDMTVPVEARGLRTQFGTNVIHDNLNIRLNAGEILGVVGGSGSGKSVLLNTLLGLKDPDGGTIRVFGQERGLMTDEDRRTFDTHVGVLFQGGALFSSLSLRENVMVPMREHTDLPVSLMRELADMKINMVGLEMSAATLHPSDLSGGMKKRAGLARALALDPQILFLDEPTAGLDPIGANAFDELILELRDALNLTVFMVTHDLDTLFTVSDRIAVLVDKHIAIADTPDNVVKSIIRGFRNISEAHDRGQRMRANQNDETG